MSRTKRFLLIGLALCAALLWFKFRDIHPSSKDIQTMQTFTDKMQTYCVGRFLIDVPHQATEIRGNYGLRLAKVETQTISHESQEVLLRRLDNQLAAEERALTGQKTYDGKALFLGRFQPSQNIRSIWFGKDDIHNQLESYIVTEGRVFKFEGGGRNQESVKAMHQHLIDVANNLTPREALEIPNTPGFCIDGGFIKMNPKQGERAGWHWTLPGHPDVDFGMATSTNGEKVESGYLDRESGIIAEYGKLMSEVTILRKRRFLIDGMAAQEYSLSLGKQEPSIELMIEIPGKSNDNAAPRISISMSVGGQGEGGYIKPSLTEGEALALFDAVIATLRLRPDAVR